MRKFLGLSTVLLLSACNFQASQIDVGGSSSSVAMTISSAGASVQAVSSAASAVSSAQAANSTQAMTEPRVIMMSVENWQFTPNVIRAKKGENVTVHLSGLSGTHGFAVPGLNISTSVAAGNSVEFTLPTDKPGIYQFFCSIPSCGSGHKDMTGQIVIEE